MKIINKFFIIFILTTALLMVLTFECKPIKDYVDTLSTVPPKENVENPDQKPNEQKVELVDSEIKFAELEWAPSEKVLEGDTIEHNYEFTNPGSEPLKLVNVRGGWGCQVVSFTKEEVPPGGSGFVNVKLMTGGKAAGEVSKSVAVETNSKKTPNLNIIIKGTVIPIFEVQNNINFERIAKTGKINKTIDIKLSKELDSTFTIKTIRTSSTNVQAKFDPIVQGKEYKITLDFNSAEVYKEQLANQEKIKEKNPNHVIPSDLNFYGNLTIETDHPKKPAVYVQFNGLFADNPQPAAQPAAPVSSQPNPNNPPIAKQEILPKERPKLP